MSRSNRVRKKSSKFADFESLDEIDELNPKKKSISKPANIKAPNPKVEDSSTDSSDESESDSDIDIKEDSMGFVDEWGENVDPRDLMDDMREEDYENEDGIHGDPSSGSKEEASYNQATSLYFSEKKKSSSKDAQGNLKGRKKSERKDKGKARFTAYMLWARAMRPKIVEENPLMDFSSVNKRLGEVWNLVPYTEKHNWKRKAKKLEAHGEKPKVGRAMISTGKVSKRGSPGRASAAKGKQAPAYGRAGHKTHTKAQTPRTAASAPRQTYSAAKSKKAPPASVPDSTLSAGFKVTGTAPVDVSAHLKLLGESLNNIGQKLKEQEGQIAVSGSLSVLLDSMLCVLGPLACLTNQLDETKGAIPDQTLAGILDNIAYIMPGIV